MKIIIILILIVILFSCSERKENSYTNKKEQDTVVSQKNRSNTIEKKVFSLFTINYDTTSLYKIGKYVYSGKRYEETLSLYKKSKTEIVYIYRVKNKTYNVERILSGKVESFSKDSLDPDVMDNIEGLSNAVETYSYNEEGGGCVLKIESVMKSTKIYNGLRLPSFAYISFYLNKGSMKEEYFYEYLPLDLNGILIRSDIPQKLYKQPD